MDYKKLAEEALAKRATLVNEMRAVLEDESRSESDKATWVANATAEMDTLYQRADEYVKLAEQAATVTSLEGRMAALPGAAGGDDAGRREERDATAEFESELRSVLTNQGKVLEIDGGAEVHQRIMGSTGVERRASGANTAMTTTSAWAGTTIQATFVGSVIDQLREHSPILSSGVRIVTTSTGEQMDWPRRNAILTAAQVAEGATYGKSKSGFDRFSLYAYKYGVIAEATYEMVNDTQIPLVQLLSADIGEALGDTTALDLLKGNGVSKPRGWVTQTVLGTTAANAAAITSDFLIKHQHSIKPKYRKNAIWYVSDDFVLATRQLKDSQGRYLWQPAITAGAPDLLLGKPVTVDVNMDLTTGGNKIPALFGDPKFFIVRMVNGVTLSRSDEYGWDSDIIAWKGSMRLDSGLTDTLSVSKITVTA